MKILLIFLILFSFAYCALYYPIYIGDSKNTNDVSTWNFENTQYFYRTFKTSVYGYIINNDGNYVFQLATSSPNTDSIVRIPLTPDKNTTQTGIIFYSQFQQNELFVILDCNQKAAQKLTNLCTPTCTKLAGRIYQGLFNYGGTCLEYSGFGPSPFAI
ncbi:transmembrane protein, putative (macronuclear) [Tetrahymena thermophila SB210]|uniref:Transmembrane protein, putative n=1 Tax=Tetrahymena thermophila (strain SB210) TaxID=312017 RepID=Q241Q6_TETTS|nr:transmembrane protein, putative [Tetrahymena thermophila SB210]EAS02514.1 transmembrane protein, putative [Tetrahymena thermophila SB210]|eukprot:XP_001022759.1 transmembrane protein, putative [Tetrahymena thermophila SB210]